MIVRFQCGHMDTKHDRNRAVSGKGKFIARLCVELNKLGIETTYDRTRDVDVSVALSKPEYIPTNAKKRVLRLGPVEYDINRKNLAERVVQAQSYFRKVDGIIYQSEFARKMNDAFLGKPKDWQKTAIIYNGADPAYYAMVAPAASPFKFNVLASTREWVWEKRLKDVIKSFQLANIPDSCLWIAGQVWDTPQRFPPKQKDYAKKYGAPNIRFLGPQNDAQVAALYRMADVLVHLVYADACPNAVVEAMCAGCKVVCTDVGGQVELVEPLYIPVPGDPKPPRKPWNRRQPPIAPIKAIAESLVYAADLPVDREYFARMAGAYLDIDVIAKKYAAFFERVLA